MPKLVAIGDSLTQGFQSLAITHVNRSFPALIARAMGLGPSEFRVPDFSARGGLPANVEWLARELEQKVGADITGFEWLKSVASIVRFLDDVEDYWEGPGMRPSAHVDFHDLAVWGFEVGDAFGVSAGHCKERIPSLNLPDVNPTPSFARERTALRVLNPSGDLGRMGDTQLTIAQRIGDSEPIEHLIVWLGGNNCLGTVVRLTIAETPEAPPGPFSKSTLWTTKAFETDYETLALHLSKIKAKNVYLGTVPHVTIPPITRGVMKDKGDLPPDRTYFDFYTRFWIRDEDFDPDRHPKLTGEQARHIDERIDSYNAIIKRVAADHRWHVVDTCSLLDRLAVRRRHGRPDKSALPPEYRDLSVRFLETASGRVIQGGLIALDGVHPTTCGYAVVAQEFVKKMREAGEQGVGDIDFKEVRRTDSLVSAPPRTLDDMFGMLRTLEGFFHFSHWT